MKEGKRKKFCEKIRSKSWKSFIESNSRRRKFLLFEYSFLFVSASLLTLFIPLPVSLPLPQILSLSLLPEFTRGRKDNRGRERGKKEERKEEKERGRKQEREFRVKIAHPLYSLPGFHFLTLVS